MSWFKNAYKPPPPIKKRFRQLWNKRWTGYRKRRNIEVYVWAKYAWHEMWLSEVYSPVN